MDATTIANGCVGMVARAPDFQLTYGAGSLPLIFGVTSENDTTLVINGPDGRWYCDDDSGDGTNPLMSIPNPPSRASMTSSSAPMAATARRPSCT